MSDVPARLNAALLHRYRVGRQLGEGGMATVYLAEDLKLSRNVALKVLKPELAAVVGAERFLAEIKTTANLQHPHILPLYDSGEADGLLFYVMPYVAGESLRDRLSREHQLSVDQAVRIATNLAEALDYAHRQGVIHRDIKPANIMLQDGKPVISDFGVALAVSAGGGERLTETGLSLGTPHYMSPEQATGDIEVGAASDIYSLGCVLFETLVGEPPHGGRTAQAILSRILTEPPKRVAELRPIVPAHVDAVVRTALERVPADRFGTAADFARALADPTFRHSADGTAEPARADGRRWPAISALLALGAGGTGGGARIPLRGRPGRERADRHRRRPQPRDLARRGAHRVHRAVGGGGRYAGVDTGAGRAAQPARSGERRGPPALLLAGWLANRIRGP
jgi:serine/threonine protein kinase